MFLNFQLEKLGKIAPFSVNDNGKSKIILKVRSIVSVKLIACQFGQRPFLSPSQWSTMMTSLNCGRMNYLSIR